MALGALVLLGPESTIRLCAPFVETAATYSFTQAVVDVNLVKLLAKHMELTDIYTLLKHLSEYEITKDTLRNTGLAEATRATQKKHNTNKWIARKVKTLYTQ